MRRYNPQLAAQSDEFFLATIEGNSNMPIGKKWNGFRELLYIGDGANEVIARSGADHSKYLPHFAGANLSRLAGTVLDCEAVTRYETVGTAKSAMSGLAESAVAWQKTHGQVNLVVFDCIVLRERELVHMPFEDRLGALDIVFDQLPKDLPFVREQLITSDKLAYYEREVVGGEGVVIKRLDASYREGKRDWLKVKKHKSWDVFVIDFTPGNGKYEGSVGAIVYGACTDEGNDWVIGKCSGMTDSQRDAFAANPDWYKGKVIEVEGFEIGNGGAIVHPRFKGFRDDKQASECLLRDVWEGWTV